MLRPTNGSSARSLNRFSILFYEKYDDDLHRHARSQSEAPCFGDTGLKDKDMDIKPLQGAGGGGADGLDGGSLAERSRDQGFKLHCKLPLVGP